MVLTLLVIEAKVQLSTPLRQESPYPVSFFSFFKNKQTKKAKVTSRRRDT